MKLHKHSYRVCSWLFLLLGLMILPSGDGQAHIGKGRTRGVVSKASRSGKGKITSARFNKAVKKGSATARFNKSASKTRKQTWKKGKLKNQFRDAGRPGRVKTQFRKAARESKVRAHFRKRANRVNNAYRFARAAKPHVYWRMKERKIPFKAAQNAYKRGTRFYDRQQGSHVYFLRNGMGRKKHVVLTTVAGTSRWKTVFTTNKNLSKSRYVRR